EDREREGLLQHERECVVAGAGDEDAAAGAADEGFLGHEVFLQVVDQQDVDAGVGRGRHLRTTVCSRLRSPASGRTKSGSAAPIAARGIAECRASPGSGTAARPPQAFTCARPRAPSSFAPVSTKAASPVPYASAQDSSSTS